MISKSELAGRQMGITITEMVKLMYHKINRKKFYKGLIHSLNGLKDIL